MIQLYIYVYTCGNIINNNDERTDFFRKIYLSHFILERVAKGLMFFMCERWVGDGTDCPILTPSSSDHSSTSSSFCWAAQPWVLRAQALCLKLVLTPASYIQLELQLQLQLQLELNWLKPSVAPGYIIVWHPPASCGRTHLHRIQPRPQVKVIFRYLRPDAPVIYTDASLNWRLGRGSI